PIAAATLQRIGLDPAVVAERLSSAGTRRARPVGPPDGIGEDFPLTSHARRLLEVASRFARSGSGTLEPVHLLVAGLSERRGALARLLGESGVDAAGAAAELAASVGIAEEAVAPPRQSPDSADAPAARDRRSAPRQRAESGPPGGAQDDAPEPRQDAARRARREPAPRREPSQQVPRESAQQSRREPAPQSRPEPAPRARRTRG